MGKSFVACLNFPQLGWGEEGPSGGLWEGAANGCWGVPPRLPFRIEVLTPLEATWFKSMIPPCGQPVFSDRSSWRPKGLVS